MKKFSKLFLGFFLFFLTALGFQHTNVNANSPNSMEYSQDGLKLSYKIIIDTYSKNNAAVEITIENIDRSQDEFFLIHSKSRHASKLINIKEMKIYDENGKLLEYTRHNKTVPGFERPEWHIKTNNTSKLTVNIW